MDNLIKDELREGFKPEIHWFRKKLHSVIPRTLRKPLFVTVFILSLLLDMLIAIGIKQGIITINTTTLINTNYSHVIQQSGNNNKVVLSEATECLSRFCSDFADDKWTDKERFILVQKDPLVLKSPNSISLPGATMYYKEEVGSFTAQIFITPQASISANLTLTYGRFYRCILGDSDYKIISCQINQGYPTIPENWSYFDEDGIMYGKNKRYLIRPFESNKEMQIRFEQKENNGNTIISIKINNQVPAEWILPKRHQGQTLREKVGLGLISTTYGDSQAIFKRFELSPQP